MLAGGPAFSAYQSSAQAISALTWTKVQFQTKEFDTATAFDNTTNYRFQPTVAGYYQVNGVVNGSAAAQMAASVYKNGAIFKTGNNLAASASSACVSALIYLNGTTDYVELWFYTGTAQNLSALANNTYFQASLARPA